LQPNVNVENAHNLDGLPPSDFSEVQDVELRNKNRGAIMANIFERYVDEKIGRLHPKDFRMMSREMDTYTSRIPKKERRKAKLAMMEHLDKRGYTPFEA